MVKLTTEFIIHKASITHNRLSRRIKEGADIKEDNEAMLRSLTHLHLQDNFIHEIGNISNCANLTVLYLQNNELQRIKNVHHLSNLTHLYLQHNKITKIENLNSLEKLKKLYLGHNQIAVVEGLDRLQHLEELHLEKQNLPQGETLYFEPRTVRAMASCVKTLNISGNHLTSISDLASLQEIQHFIAKDNKFFDLSEIASTIGNWLYIATLELRGNPISSQQKYREKLIASASWSLASLDHKSIPDSTRVFMKKFDRKREELAIIRSSKDFIGDHQLQKGAGTGSPSRHKPYGGSDTTGLQLSVTGGQLSEDMSSYQAWQSFGATSSKAVLLIPYQKQNQFLQKKSLNPFIQHLPTTL